MKRWYGWLGLAVVLAVTAGTLFAVTRSLERADQLASVAAFLLALAVAGVGVIGYLGRRRSAVENESTDQPVEPSAPAHPPQAPRTVNNSKFVNMGDNSTINAEIDGGRRRKS